MKKQRKPLSTKKPPVPSNDHQIIKDWMKQRIMPGIQPLIVKIDRLIHDSIPGLIVFLNGAAFDPEPPLGTGGESRYIKLKTTEELDSQPVINFIK